MRTLSEKQTNVTHRCSANAYLIHKAARSAEHVEKNEDPGKNDIFECDIEVFGVRRLC